MGPKSDFKFITVDATEGTFQTASKSTRSHAIRTAIQRGRSDLGSSTASISQDTIKQKAQLKGRFRLAGTTLKSTKPKGPKHLQEQEKEQEDVQSTRRSHSPSDIAGFLHQASLPPWVQRLGSDSADPFNTLPIPSSPCVDSLVKYCKSRSFYRSRAGRRHAMPLLFNLNSTTIDTQRPWFPYAMQSALIMRVTLALAAEFLTATMPLLDFKLQREGYQQKGEAMRMIRDRLASQESARSASNDLSVLAGVAMLGSVEAFQGHFSAANVHLTGLHAMIEARGGPETIKHDYILCRCINWIDIQVASGLGRVPKFPMFHTLAQVSLPPSVVNRARTPSLRHLEKLGGHIPDESDEPLRIFVALRQAILSQAGGAVSVSADDIRIVMNTADSTILHFLYVERRTATPVQKRFLVLVSAAHVFLYTVLREIPTTGHMVRVLVRRMRDALDDADSIALMWVSHDAALLWVLFVGIVGSGTTEDREWFSSRLNSLLERARGILPPERCRRENLQQLLSGFLWRDKHCLPVLDEVWATWERGQGGTGAGGVGVGVM
ncbi:tachykinin family protein [Colletotrichum scovillei]|uniref:Tachykinin family protein n=1 Tax=Colletotrichum scovillei TaxID=1209932 RepID=A0A9P7QV16_9PEZI|nr:tachykinin family protein [Colletotrichum scovillei]KAG7045777.1 tachykinin family protein [Colletotrichum scovillei]KAG7063123.1 tachykinin family protein [Colletotrichum scovillei]